MYNKAKYIVDVVGSIIACILGIFIFASCIFSFRELFSLPSPVGKPGERMFISLVIRGLIAIVFIWFAIKTIQKPFLYPNERGIPTWTFSDKGKNLTLIILSGIFFVFGILSSILLSLLSKYLGNAQIISNNVAQWIQNILCLAVFVLKIIALVLKPDQKTAVSDQVSTENLSNQSNAITHK